MTGYVAAAEIVHALKGRWSRNKGSCRCPAHDDRDPSLSVTQGRDGRVLVHCFAGCGQMDVINALQRVGLWGDGGAEQDPSAPWNFIPRDKKPADANDRKSAAQAVWDSCRPAAGTLAETYLRSRGLKTKIPDVIRFHPKLRHGHNDERTYWPAMVAKLEDNRGFVCIQRTYLAQDGRSKSPVDKPKMALGGMYGSAVRLKPLGPSGFLGLAEGIESAASAAQIYCIPVWAALGAYRLGQIDVPRGVRVLTIFGDAGDAGTKEAFKAQEIYEAQGLTVEVILPAAHFGKVDDFNTALRTGANGAACGRSY